MHWFEQLTGLNPDGGNGLFESFIEIFVLLVGWTATIRFVRWFGKR